MNCEIKDIKHKLSHCLGDVSLSVIYSIRCMGEDNRNKNSVELIMHNNS